MFFAIFVIGVLVTTALYTWYTFSSNGGLYETLKMFRNKINNYDFGIVLLFSTVLGVWFVLSILAWPLMLIVIGIALSKQFNKTGSFKSNKSV